CNRGPDTFPSAILKYGNTSCSAFFFQNAEPDYTVIFQGNRNLGPVDVRIGAFLPEILFNDHAVPISGMPDDHYFSGNARYASFPCFLHKVYLPLFLHAVYCRKNKILTFPTVNKLMIFPKHLREKPASARGPKVGMKSFFPAP